MRRLVVVLLLIVVPASGAWCWSRGSGSELGGSDTRPGVVFPVFGGDGSDGDYAPAISGNLTVSAAGKQWRNVVIPAGVTITVVADTTAGAEPRGSYRFAAKSFVLNGTLNLQGLGSAGASGASSTASDANGSSGQAVLSQSETSLRRYTVLFGSPGVGGGGAGASSTRSGGNGGAATLSFFASTGGSSGAAGASGSSGTDYSSFTPAAADGWWLHGYIALAPGYRGAGGGGGGGNGGGRGGTGGAGGPGVVIEALRASGTGTISVAGGNAPNENTVNGAGRGATNMGGGGGGGGGAGGQCAVLYRYGAAPSYTITVTGGNGGTGALAGYGGGSIKGGDGRAGTAGRSAIRKVW